MPDGHCRWPSFRVDGRRGNSPPRATNSTVRVPEKKSLRVRRRRLGGIWPRPIIDGALSGPSAKGAYAHYPQSVSSHWEGNGYSRAIITDPGGWLNNTAHNEPHVLAIDLPDRSSSDQPIKLLSFHSGDSFFFLDLPLARIVDQPAYPASSGHPGAGHGS